MSDVIVVPVPVEDVIIVPPPHQGTIITPQHPPDVKFYAPSGPPGPPGPPGITPTWWTGTQAEYDLLGSYDANTLYIIHT